MQPLIECGHCETMEFQYQSRQKDLSIREICKIACEQPNVPVNQIDSHDEETESTVERPSTNV